MNPLTLNNALFAPLFTDATVAAAFSTERTLAAFIAFEAALAEALAELGLATPEKADAAAAAIRAFRPDLDRLAAATTDDGLPVPDFVAQLKAHVGDDLKGLVHVGATSQDLIDTATVLALRDVSDHLAAGLTRLSAHLTDLEARFGSNAMMARTRMQAALAFTVADRLATWRLPLDGHLARLAALRPGLERIQFGGAVGDRRFPDGQGEALARSMAERLGLAPALRAWHAMRESFAEYAGWLSLVTGSLGKIGADICLMAQQGVEEIGFAAAGKSSAMPHKQNPVRAELLVAFARFNAGELAGMHHALVHEQERSGAAWALEWMTLPGMAMTTAAAIARAEELLATVNRIGAPR
ncbi:MAG: 3-carboxy-cis,cis-muconate cycloisomerase [Rhodobacteraceae bacterium]|nr:3-carboxy-cis,cis-muconate cycloisomerase [Paracoccaceae bacterium]